MTVKLTWNFFANARGLTIADGGGIVWSFNANTNTLTATGGSGGVLSSVGLADTSTTPIYTVSNSPLTTNGTLNITLNAQAKNLVFIGPVTGANAQPTFRALAAADLPGLGANPSAKVGPAATNGSATTYLRSDAAPAIDLTANYTWTGTHTFDLTIASVVSAGGTARTATDGTVVAFELFAGSLYQVGTSSAHAHIINTSNASRVITDAAGITYMQQPTPTAINATATLTIAQLLTLIITSTTAAAVTGTLPTGTLTDAAIIGNASPANTYFDWSVINTGLSNSFTVAAGTGHTLVGSSVVAASTSGRFRSRKTAANTFVTYRLS